MAYIPLRGPKISRRTLVGTIPAIAVAALLAEGENDIPLHGASPPKPPTPVSHPVAPKPTVIPSQRSPQPTPHTPVQSRAVFTLADYRKVVPGPAFPSHAVALTIDDGPHPVWTPLILRLLDKYHVPATFFMIGNQVRGHETVARSVVHAGHQVANHTWSHPIALYREHQGQIRQELHRAQDKIYSTTGQPPVLFRSPGGSWSPTLFRQVAQAGMIPIDWSDDPRDWSRPGTASIVRHLLAAKPGQILLCHDGGGDRSETYAALQKVIPALQARGYHFVPLVR